MSSFQDLLSSRTLVADGATGTALFDLGLESGGCPEQLNIDRPDLISKVHNGYLEAGADLILTNTFGGNRARLRLHGLEEHVAELNGAAAALAQQAAAQADRPVVVAGSVGPTGELYKPIGPFDREEGVEIFSEQAAALVEAGVDVLWIETLSSFEELSAAVDACAGRGIPVTATLSFDTNGHTMMGISPGQYADWWNHDQRLVGIGVNCGIGPADNVAAAAGIARATTGVALIVKGNCGIPLYQDDALVYPSGPEMMTAYATMAMRAGADVVGACCGSGFDHIAEVRKAVDAFEGGQAPTLEEIEESLGKVARPTRRGRTR